MQLASVNEISLATPRCATVLQRLGVLNDAPFEALDRLVRLATLACGAPSAAAMFFDADVLRCKSVHGAAPATVVGSEIDAAIGIAEQLQGVPLTLPELANDAAWHTHPWVAGAPSLRFLATAPLQVERCVIGALWVMDTRARSMDGEQRATLDAVAAEINDLLARRLAERPAGPVDDPPDAARAQLHHALLKSAGQAVHVGGWVADLATRRMTWSEEVAAIHRMPGVSELSFRDVVSLYVPEAQASLMDSFRRCAVEGVPYDDEREIVTPDGGRAWVRSTGRAVRDETGTIVRIEGALQDIDAHKRTEVALRESEERFKYAARATADAVWDWDLVADTIWWSEGLHSLFGVALSDMPAESTGWKNRIHPEDRARVLDSIAAVIHSGGELWQDDYRFRRGDGAYADVRDRGYVIRNAAGQPVRMVGGMADCTKKNAAEAAARRDAQLRAEIVQIQHALGSHELEMAQVHARIAESALALTGAHGAAVEMLEDGRLVRRGLAGDMAFSLGHSVPLDRTLSGEAVRTGETVVSGDLERDGRTRVELARAVHARSAAVAPLRVGGETLGVLAVVAEPLDAFGEREVNTLRILADTLAVTLQRHRMLDQQRASEAQYRLLFDHNPQPMWVYDIENLRFLAANRAMLEHYGWPLAQLMQGTVRLICPPEDVAQMEARARSRKPAEKVARLPTRHRVRRDGVEADIDVEIYSEPIQFAGRAARLVLANDVSDRLRAARELARLARARDMLSAYNKMMVRTPSEAALLDQLCRITVEIGHYRMAWVGFARDDEARSIDIVSRAGDGVDYLDGLKLTWSATDVLGQGPSGRAIRNRMPAVVDDMNQDPTLQEVPDERAAAYAAFARQWRDRAQERGIRSVIALPLISGDDTFGVLTLYAADIMPAGGDEIQLLQELADNLSHDIHNLRAQAREQRMQAAVVKMAAAVSALSGTEFMEQLVRNMVDALGAQAGFIVRLVPGAPEPAGRGRTVVAMANGRLLEPFEYSLAGSPCENWLEADEWVIAQRASEYFPSSAILQRVAAQGYVGRCLENANGQVMGLVFALFAQSLQETAFAVSTLQIFSARASAELERQEADAHIRYQASLLDKAQDAILVRNIDHRIVFWNLSAERLYGWSAEEALGRSCAELLFDDAAAYHHANAAALAQGEWTGEMTKRRKDGSQVTVEARWTVVKNERGEARSVLCIDTDITLRKATEREIQKLAFYDPLTALPNRMLLMDRLQQAVANCLRSGCGGALLFIDLDNFKTLNDTLGHDQGDLLLQQVAQRLAAAVREVDTVARLGGDEFVVMLESLSDDADELAVQARAVGEKVLSALNTVYLLGGFEHRSTASIGIAPFRNQHVGVGELLKQADLAMYQAKTAGRNTLRFFDPGMQAVVTARAGLETDLRRALVQGELLLHYQPQVGPGGVITGVEALVRWQHPTRGMVSPADFIPLAEDTGMILPLGQWVLHTACTLLARWAQQPGTAPDRTMAVNVSARQFRHPDFVQHVVDVLAETRAPAHRLKLELTESLLVEDMEGTIAKMSALKAHGVGFSLDDFGTGYSSLSYLKRLPLDQIKIDQSFVQDVLTDPNDAAIVRTIIGLGHSLGLAVIGEGVETEEQRLFLAEHGCLAWQGYLFSRPLPADLLEAFLHR